MVEPFGPEGCNSYQHPTSPSFITSRVLSGILLFSVESRRSITVDLKRGLKTTELTLSDCNEFSLRKVECSGAPNDNFRNMSVRNMISDL